MSIEQNLCKVKIFPLIYVRCDTMYQSKVYVQEFSYMVSGLDIQLENPGMTVLYAKNQLQALRFDESCTVFFSNSYEPIE